MVDLNGIVGVQDTEEAFWQHKHEPGCGVSWTVHIQVLKSELPWEQPVPSQSSILFFLFLTKITQRVLAGIAIFRVSWDVFPFIASVLHKLIFSWFLNILSRVWENIYTHIFLFVVCFYLISRNIVTPFHINNQLFLVEWSPREQQILSFPSLCLKHPANL